MNIQKVQELLDLADVKINGKRDHDLQVLDERFYDRVLSEGSMGLGESYMDGWWTAKKLDVFFYKILNAQLDKKVKTFNLLFLALKSKIFNSQTLKGARKVGKEHYDLGNDLYEKMLDKGLNYSCGYWKDAKTLDKAQEAKLDLCCRKMQLKKGMRVLDIGCGWGGFAEYAARKYGVEVLGVTISKEQAAYAKERCKKLPVKILLQDYRKVTGKFDAIVSIGMIEHVGHKNYKTYFEVAERCLKDDGIFLLHTIGGNNSVVNTDAWMNKYIFPNSHLPSLKQIMQNVEGKFVVEDLHNFGIYYNNTLMAWYSNFKKNWPSLKKNYSERFYKMWEYYLLSCAGSFRARKNHLWQIVLSKKGVRGGYVSVR
ncbi:MAG: cyclopropane fatty acyl phospholipid synthase [Candidatus Woesearchaeota archaeon]